MAVTSDDLAATLGWLRNLVCLLEHADERIAVALRQREDFTEIVAELPHGGGV